MRPPGPWEIALILVVILIIFGVGKLPQVGDALGKGIRAFRRGQNGEEEPDTNGKKEGVRPKKAAAKKETKS